MAEKQIQIPAIERSRLLVELVGTTPLIVHRFGEQQIAEMERTQSGAAKLKKVARDPERDFRDGFYLIDGTEPHRFGDLSLCRFGFPTRAIKRTIVTAGQRFAGEASTVLNGVLTPTTTMVELIAPPPTRGTDMVRYQGKTTDLAYRPYFEPWRMEVEFDFLPQFISLDQLLNLISLGGFTVGLGEWRVDRKGVNGQYALGRSQVLSD